MSGRRLAICPGKSIEDVIGAECERVIDRDEPPPGFVFFPRFERRGPSIDPSWFACNQGLARERQAGAYLR